MIHGLRATYVKGCRCDDCRRANTRYAKVRELHPPQLVDSTAVRAHVQELRAAGVGKRTIAKRAGVAQTVIDRLLGIATGRPAKRVRVETARRILAVTVDDLADGSFIDGTGTRRRLQALVAMGWPQSTLAPRIGWTPSNFGTLIHSSVSVTVATATVVRSVYDTLCMRPGPSQRARTIATKYGWPTPLAWDDDIDNPEAQPAGGRRGRDRINPEDVLELHQAGETKEAIAQRLGLSVKSIDVMVRRGRQRVAS